MRRVNEYEVPTARGFSIETALSIGLLSTDQPLLEQEYYGITQPPVTDTTQGEA